MSQKISNILLDETEIAKQDKTTDFYPQKNDKWLINQFSQRYEKELSQFANSKDKVWFLNQLLTNNKFSNQIIDNEYQNQDLYSNLSMNDLYISNMDSIMQCEFTTANEVWIISPFISNYGVTRMRYFLENNNKLKINIITTTYDGTAKFLSLETLIQLKQDYSKRINVRIENLFLQSNEQIHAKAYFFIRDNGFSNLYIGSSNFTRTGMQTGKEFNVKISEFREKELIQTFKNNFLTIWNEVNMVDIADHDAIQHLLKLLLVSTPDPLDTYEQNKVISNAMQMFKKHEKKLYQYQEEIVRTIFQREIDGKNRHLLVMATGTGKTYTIASYVKTKMLQENKHLKMLYLAHQKEILEQAISTFAEVFEGIKEPFEYVEFFDQQSTFEEFKNTNNAFATIQTLNNYISDLSNLEFDIVIFDEAHHLEAKTFNYVFEVLSKTSKTLIGLTATPKRTDGVDISKYFYHEYACQITLANALENKLLSSFDYYFINDKSVNLTGVSLDDTEKLGEILSQGSRNEFIFEIISKNIGIENKNVSVLLFCASAKQAKELSNYLQISGLRSEFLISEGLNSETRKNIIDKFKTKQINFLCVKDIFNEGVDIPSIDIIFFLRPTASLIVYLQQLGIGLRKELDKKLQVYDFVNNIDMKINKNYYPIHLIEAFQKQTELTCKDLMKDEFVLSSILPSDCNLFFEKRTMTELLNKLKEFEQSNNPKNIIKKYQNESQYSYEQYKQFFDYLEATKGLTPFNFYNKNNLTFDKANTLASKLLSRFCVMNLKWVLEEWIVILENKQLDLTKTTHKLFMANMCNNKYSKQNSVFQTDLHTYWEFVKSDYILLTELIFLITYKLEKDYLNYIENTQTISSFKNGYFTYDQIPILFGEGIKNNIFKHNSRPQSVYNIISNDVIILASEYTSMTEFEHVNYYNRKEKILTWESPDNWKFNTNKIDLNNNKYFVFGCITLLLG